MRADFPPDLMPQPDVPNPLDRCRDGMRSVDPMARPERYRVRLVPSQLAHVGRLSEIATTPLLLYNGARPDRIRRAEMRMRVRWGGLRTKIIAWFLVPTIVIFSGAALFTFYTYQRVTEELVLERNREMTQLLAQQLSAEFLEIYSSQLGALLVSPDFPQSDPAGQQEFLRQASGRLEAFDGGVIVLDAHGVVTAADPSHRDAVGQDWSDYPFVPQALTTQGVSLSDIFPRGPQGRYAVALAVSVSNGGAIAGMFYLEPQSDANGLYRSVSRLLGRFVRSGQNAYLVDGNGRIIYHSARRSGEDWQQQEVVQRVLAGEADSLRTTDFDGREVVASFAPLGPPLSAESASANPGSSALTVRSKKLPSAILDAKAAYAPSYGMVSSTWGLVVEESWADLTRTSQLYGRWLLLLLALGALVPATVIAVGAGQITRPIARFTGAAEEMAAGHLDQAIDVSTGDELEELADQFNHMATQLRDSYANLEQRVTARTRELTTLNAVAAVVSRSLELEEVLDAALARTLEATGMDVGLAYCLEEESENLALMAFRGTDEETTREVQRLSAEMVGTRSIAAAHQPIAHDVFVLRDSPFKRFLETAELKMIVVIPLTAKGRSVGFIYLGSRTRREVPQSESSLMAAIGQQTGMAVENARLYEHAEESAVTQERNRLARDLHDAVTQTLFSASLIAEVLPRIWERNPDEGQHRLDELRELTRGALAEMRTLLLELRPAALLEARLGDLLRQLTESITGRARVPVTVEVEGKCDPPPEVKVALYRIAQEALNNVAKHAGASQAAVRLACRADVVTLEISDDGRGFDPSAVSPQSLGTGIMRERAGSAGAALKIDSRPGQGTRVMVRWPGGEN